MHARTLAYLGLFLSANFLLVLLLRHHVPETAALFNNLGSASPWFVPAHFSELYLLTPLVVMAAMVVLLAPGVLLVLAYGGTGSAGELVLKGFVIAFLLHALTTTLVKLLTGAAMTPVIFISLLAATLTACYLYLFVRHRSGHSSLDLLLDTGNRRQLLWMLAIPFLFVAPLLPVIFWQDLNSDGFEAMEIGRTLSSQILPAFPNASGTMGLGIGMLPMAYPVHWCIMLFGPIEAATRLPMVFYLAGVFAGLLAFIQYQSPRHLRPAEEGVILLALATYVVAVGFNSGYDPYFSDLSSPAAFETLTSLFIIGSGYFLWTGRYNWFLLFSVLGFLARPTMLLFVILLGLGMAVTAHPDRRRSLLMIAAAIGIWGGLLIGFEYLYIGSISGDTGPGYPSSSIIDRFHYLTFSDLQRLVYAAAPAGLIPALSLLAWRWHDSVARCIVIITAGYFLVFYVPAFTSLHHFIPAMILPLIALWRMVIAHTYRLMPVVVIGLIAAIFIWLSLPQHFEINRVYRGIGQRTEYNIGDYSGSYAGYRKAIASSDLISSLFANDWNVADSSIELIGGAQLIYYAHTSKHPDQAINYLFLSPGTVPPSGFSLVTESKSGSTFIRNRSIWDADRYNPVGAGFRSTLYKISDETLFPYKGVPANNYDVDMASFPLIWRLFSR